MSNLSVENVYTRQEAKELTKKHFWKLLGMVVIIALGSYGLSMGGTALLGLTGNESIILVGSLAVLVVVSLLSCGLSLGLIAAMIDLCRGNADVTVGAVFCRMGSCLKGVGLSLWIGLKSLLWALPGYVLMVAGIVMVAGMGNTSSPEDNAGIMTLMMLGGMVLLFALLFPAVYRYMLSTYILADHPETGVFECVKQSKALMKGHKWQAFKLIVPIILVMYVIMLVVVVALGAVMTLVGNSTAAAAVMGIVIFIAMFAVILYYMIRAYLCYTVFYLKRVAEHNPAAQSEGNTEIEAIANDIAN